MPTAPGSWEVFAGVQLATVLPKLIAATEAGELDGHINAVTKSKQPVVMKRSAALSVATSTSAALLLRLSSLEPIKTQLADAQKIQIPWDVSCICFTLDE